MSEWDFDQSVNGKSGNSKTFQAGKWDVALTAVALVAVTAVSFLVAWLTKDIPSRPFWMLGLCFAAPVAALMLSVFLKEKASSTMTPSTSRKAQLILAGCTVLAAAVVGCFCQVTNEKADTFEEVVTGEGWSDVLIILDKSGSMSWTQETFEMLLDGMDYMEAREHIRPGDESMDDMATNAVLDLIGQLDEKTQVGMLIYVGWEENKRGTEVVSLDRRLLPIEPLTPEHRQQLLNLARSPLYNNENFVRAFEVACEMIEKRGGEKGSLSILLISDGNDVTEKFRAVTFAGRLNEYGVKVNYLYVTSEPSEEMKRLAEQTGGESIYVSERVQLLDQMQKMVTVPIYTTVYKDALRDLDESERAKIVTGILLLLLGVLIGISLTVMLSVHGQRRFQVILSPLMAVCAFLILVYGKGWLPEPWIREGVAFSLLGVVLMRANRPGGLPAVKPQASPGEETAVPIGSTDDPWA